MSAFSLARRPEYRGSLSPEAAEEYARQRDEWRSRTLLIEARKRSREDLAEAVEIVKPGSILPFLGRDDEPTPTEPEKPKKTLKERAIDYVSALSDWLPAEATAIYAAGVVAYVAADADYVPPQWDWFWIGTIVFAMALQFFACRTAGNAGWPTFWRVGLTAIAFTLWSSTIPNGWWSRWEWVDFGNPAVAIWFVVLACVFTGMAEWISRKNEPDQEGAASRGGAGAIS